MASQPLITPGKGIDEAHFASFGKILLLAGPLIFSQMGVMLMQIVDGIFLARYSEASIAAIGPAGMSFWLVCGLFIGLAGYTSTFVAQYVGAKRPDRVGAALWQGIYIALAAGAILALTSFASDWLFKLAGHQPQVQQQEVIYFRILCYGGWSFLLSSALSGFFAGRHDNVPLLVAHLVGAAINAFLNWCLIFGNYGFPEMGIAGAAWATVTGTVVQVIMMGLLVFQPRFAQEFNTWRDWRLDPKLMWRMCLYGFPNGVRFIVEIAAWTAFLFIIGRVNPQGLAASNIAWRINGMAFFPVIGLSIAVSMLVGQAQGAGRPDLSRKVTKRGLVIGEIWMASAAAAMLLFPHSLLRMFFKAELSPDEVLVYAMCVKLLWFVAAYSVVDNLNIIFMAVLSGAGDTRWLLLMSGGLHLTFLVALGIMGWLEAGIYAMWFGAATFICLAAIAWVWRFRTGAWENKRVIEHAPPDLHNPAFPGPDASIS